MVSDRYPVSYRRPAVQAGSQIRLPMAIPSATSREVSRLVGEAQRGQIQAWDLWMRSLPSGQELLELS